VIVYDGEGNRVRKTVAGVTTLFLVDDQNPTGYAQAVEELTSTGGLRRALPPHQRKQFPVRPFRKAGRPPLRQSGQLPGPRRHAMRNPRVFPKAGPADGGKIVRRAGTSVHRLQVL
jgi:hypothetical protein